MDGEAVRRSDDDVAGDTARFGLVDGIKTGWPIQGRPDVSATIADILRDAAAPCWAAAAAPIAAVIASRSIAACAAAS